MKKHSRKPVTSTDENITVLGEEDLAKVSGGAAVGAALKARAGDFALVVSLLPEFSQEMASW